MHHTVFPIYFVAYYCVSIKLTESLFKKLWEGIKHALKNSIFNKYLSPNQEFKNILCHMQIICSHFLISNFDVLEWLPRFWLKMPDEFCWHTILKRKQRFKTFSELLSLMCTVYMLWMKFFGSVFKYVLHQLSIATYKKPLKRPIPSLERR